MKIYNLSSSTETGMNSPQFAQLWYVGIVNEYRATRGHRDEITQAQKSPGVFPPPNARESLFAGYLPKISKGR